MFLDREQLIDMTGFVNCQKQCDWLAQNGYSFDVRSDGRPNVLVEQVRRRQLAKYVSRTESKPGIDLSWLKTGEKM